MSRAAAVAVALLPFAGGCGAPDLRDPETVEKIAAEAFAQENLQERGDLIYAPNRSEPYSGWAVDYYTGGQIHSLLHYRGGEVRRFTYWHENGQMRSQGDHRDGERHGQWTEWYEYGQMSYQAPYVDGERRRPWTRWHPWGGIREQYR